MPHAEGILPYLRAGQYRMYPSVGFPEPSLIVDTGPGALKCPSYLLCWLFNEATSWTELV